MPPFERGDKVVLASEYYVNEPGDCRHDSAARGVKVGHTGVVNDGGSGIVTVRWDGAGHALRINSTCLGHEDTVTDDEMNEVLKSISATFQERKQR